MSVKNDLNNLKLNIQDVRSKLYTNLVNKGVTNITATSTLNELADSVSGMTNDLPIEEDVKQIEQLLLDEFSKDWDTEYCYHNDCLCIYSNDTNLYSSELWNNFYYDVNEQSYKQMYCLDGSNEYNTPYLPYDLTKDKIFTCYVYDENTQETNETTKLFSGFAKRKDMNYPIEVQYNDISGNTNTMLLSDRDFNCKELSEWGYYNDAYIENPLTYNQYNTLHQKIELTNYYRNNTPYDDSNACGNISLNTGSTSWGYIEIIDDDTLLFKDSQESYSNIKFEGQKFLNVFVNGKHYTKFKYIPSQSKTDKNYDLYKFPLRVGNVKEFKVLPNDRPLITMERLFEGYYGIERINLPELYTNNVTDMSHMFANCSSLRVINMPYLTTEGVTDMGYMFANCSSLQYLDLSNFDTSSVGNMDEMFSGCTSLQSLDLSNFDTSSVTDMNNMFANCSSLQSLDLSNFDTSNVNGMGYMFANCSSLQSLDLSNFDTSNVNGMSGMIGNCPLLRDFKINGMGRGTYFSMYLGSCLLLGVNSEDFPNALQSFKDTFIYDIYDRAAAENAGTLQFSTNTLSLLTEDEIAQITSKGYTIA